MIKISGGHDQWWSATLDQTSLKHDFNHTQVQHLTFQESADYTAHLISRKYNNLFIAMSGGLDSSFVAEVFYRNQIPFTPIIGYLSSDEQTANCDYFYAMHWCQHKNIVPIVIDYKIDDPRLIKQYVNMAKKAGLVAIGSCIPLALADEVNLHNGHLIIGDPMIPHLTEGNNYFNPIGSIFDSPWYAIVVELLYPNQEHPGGFFFYTPEILLAQAQEIDLTLNESVAKTKLYNIPYRPKTYPDFDCISKSTADKLSYYYKLNHVTPGECWDKKDLIQKLVK
jgi:hypothetical protein